MIMRNMFLLLVFPLMISCNYLSVESRDTKNVQYTHTYDLKFKNGQKSGKIIIRLPKNYRYRQKIVSESFSIKPKKIYEEDGDRVVLFVFDDSINSIVIDIFAEIYKYDYTIAKEKILPATLFFRKKYLDYSKNDYSDLREDASKLKSISDIYNYVNNTLTYEEQEFETSGYDAFKRGTGDCTEFSDLFVTLCRMNKIPAREIYGYKVGSADVGHMWAEVFLDRLGWIPVETISGTGLSPKYPSKMYNEYFYMAHDVFKYNFTFKVTKNILVTSFFKLNYVR